MRGMHNQGPPSPGMMPFGMPQASMIAPAAVAPAPSASTSPPGDGNSARSAGGAGQGVAHGTGRVGILTPARSQRRHAHEELDASLPTLTAFSKPLLLQDKGDNGAAALKRVRVLLEAHHADKGTQTVPPEEVEAIRYTWCCCVLLCVAVCCCVLLCVAVCCCALLCIVVCCCVLLCVAVCCCVLLCVAVFCCVLLCATVYCCVWWCVAETVLPEKVEANRCTQCCSALQGVAVCCSMLQWLSPKKRSRPSSIFMHVSISGWRFICVGMCRLICPSIQYGAASISRLLQIIGFFSRI